MTNTILIDFLEQNMLPCGFKSLGVECMGCGLQRSFIFLLQGQFVNAFKMYPAIYTLILMFLYLVLHIKYNFAKGHQILLGLFLLNTIIISINYFSKLL